MNTILLYRRAIAYLVALSMDAEYDQARYIAARNAVAVTFEQSDSDVETDVMDRVKRWEPARENEPLAPRYLSVAR